MSKSSVLLFSALDHHRAGRLHLAAASYHELLSSDPSHPDALHLLGVLTNQLGEANLAVELISRAIVIQPRAADYHSNLGNALRAQGKPSEAECSYRQAIAIAPRHSDAYRNLALLLEEQGRLKEAQVCYELALRIAPHEATVLLSLAKVTVALGDLDRGIGILRDVILSLPEPVPAHIQLGNSLLKAGERGAAENSYLRALALDASNADALFNLGRLYLAAEDFAAALPVCERAAALRPAQADAYNNLGLAYLGLKRMDLAAEAFQRAIEADASYARAYFHLAHVFTQRKEYNKVIETLDTVLSIDPLHAAAHWNLSTTLLLTGDYARGWQEYEWRWQQENRSSPKRNFTEPQWKGERLLGDTILLHAEQGFGDTLQFVRYVPMVAARGGRVILEVQPRLKSLLQRVPGVSQCISCGDSLPEFSVQCSLMSLPLAFGTLLGSVPPPPPDLFGAMPRQSKSRANPFRVGLAWAGNPKHPGDSLRSIPFIKLAPLLAVPGLSFFSLQKNDTAARAQLDSRLPSLLSAADDFAGDRLAVAGLDLIITVDTAMAHFAGSMGLPVWILLSDVPDWRWGLQSETTPWYPTARLFRCADDRGWAGLLQRVAKALEELMQQLDE